MDKSEIKRWLKDDEICISNMSVADYIQLLSGRLARRAELLDRAKQFIEDDLSGMPFDDDRVKKLNDRGKKIYEEIAAEIEGLPREENDGHSK